jgi:hypothetical protein
VPDLRPLAAEALAHHATALPVTLLVAAPESEAGSFDDFGRPCPLTWLEREIAFTDPAYFVPRDARKLKFEGVFKQLRRLKRTLRRKRKRAGYRRGKRQRSR